MLNPILSNAIIQFGNGFFPEEMTEKYDTYLYRLNYPLKTFRGYFHETIQSLSVPGLSLQPTELVGLYNNGNLKADRSNFEHNTTQFTQPGNADYTSVLTDNKVTITFKNTILNWLYVWEFAYNYYKRRDRVGTFDVNVILKNSAEINILGFYFNDAFITNTAELEFSFTEALSDSKTFDISILFKEFNVRSLIPEFNETLIKL